MPTKYANSYATEDIRYITVMTPLGFVNQENQTRCYLIATIHFLYCHVLFRILILNIDWNNMMNSLDKNGDQFSSH